MNLHEYQSKELLKKYAVVVPRGRVVTTPDDAEAAARELGGTCVLKAQVHAGGRGKAGGIKKASDPANAKALAAQMIGMKLVTHQTGPEGKIVRTLLAEEPLEVKREYYVGMVIDRARSKPVMMMSSEGGVEIEEVARKSPEKIHVEEVDTSIGFQPFQARRLALKCGLDPSLLGKASGFLTGLSQAYIHSSCSLAEINPLALSADGRLLALDAKIVLDDNALFKHKDLEALRDVNEEDPREWEAKKNGLSYVSLSGTIGCMVNGAGLAMATMDIIKLFGGEPANFLDVGGGASREQVTHAFRILLADPRVKAVLINIFGGILRCDVLAQGVIEAAKTVKIHVPLVVRMEGTNVDVGRQLLRDSGLNIITADGMADAAEKVVKVAQ